MSQPEEQRQGFSRPSIDSFIFEGEETPLLLRRRVVFGIVAGFVAIVGVYVLLSYLLGFSTEIDAGPFRTWVEDLGIWGPFFFILIMALSVLFAPIPNAPIFIAAGLVWGPVLGSAYSMAGLMLGSAAAFLVARWFGRRHLPRLIGGKAAQRVDQIVDSMGGRLVFWSRMLPAVSFDWISFIAGLTSMRFWVFFVYSFLGLLLPTVLIVVAGDGLGRDFRVTLATGSFWVAGVLGSALYFWRRQRAWQSRRRAERASSAEAPERMGSIS